MPIDNDFKTPQSAQELALPGHDKAPLFLAFVSSVGSDTGLPWCPDVRAALPVLQAVFTKSEAPKLGIVGVGQKPEWREPGNIYRTKWNVSNVPTLVRYERRDGKVIEIGRLIEGEILVPEKLSKLLGYTSSL
ncbi:hypothetical protein BS50DRAFT_579204 [Corynespora cassiicola Philippines]|uniref:Thioredoxin domain-containing protein n=1 Tax=Corynespora cassiicola Philippines TaxID=1448308 RepID=A0A2T2N4E5_CORCC|nr:hypothetical protein BS50DRAFT_579204 [Corynespora cassiicola Philippines]